MKVLRVIIPSLAILFLITTFSPVAQAQLISIRGSVSADDGTPVAGAQFKAVPAQGGKALRQAKTKRNGKFSLPGVEFGTYKFTAEKPGHLVRIIKVVVRTQQNTVEEEQSIEIGPLQELPEFTIQPGRKVTVDITMVPESYFASVLSIPGNPEATEWLSQANTLGGQGKYEESDQLLLKIVDAGEATANVYYLLGRNANMREMYDDAEKWFGKTLEMNPEQKGVYAQLATIAHTRGDLDKAADLMAKEVELSPDEVSVAINYAVILTELGRHQEAIDAFLRVLELSPTEAPAYAELAGLYTEIGQEEKAIEMLEKMEEVSQPSPGHWFNIGANFSNRDMFDQAEMAYLKALEIDPTFPLAIRELGFLMIRKGEKQAALDYFSEYLDLAPDAPDIDQITGIKKALEAQIGGE